MGIWDRLFGQRGPANQPPVDAQAAGDGGVLVSTMEELEQLMRDGAFGSGYSSKSGKLITAETAMQVPAAYACVRLLTGAVANIPLHIIREDNGVKQRQMGGEYVNLLTRKPCPFMRARAFRRMATAHVLLRGNFVARKVRSIRTGHIQSLIPLHPDRVSIEQQRDMSILFKYSRPEDGKILELKQDEVLHLYSLTLNGYSGVTPITYAREVFGQHLSMDDHVSTMYKNGARVSGVFSTDRRLGSEGRANIQASLDAFRNGGSREGKDLVLEDGLSYNRISMTPQDMQFLESRKMTVSDILMLYGVPPHMIGVVEKTTSWGSGIEEQNKGFVTWALEDYLTMWEDGLNIDVIQDPNLSAYHDRRSLLRGNIQDQATFFQTMLQNRVMSPNEVRQDLDMNPYDGGDEMLPTPTMAAEQPEATQEGDGNEPTQE